MARPIKDGMDYFPHDTDATNDEKIEALRYLYGNDGYAVYFILLERIYRTSEFELGVSEAETRQILANKCLVTIQLFEQILASCLKYGCFDVEAYEKRGVLTSNGIKKRAAVVLKKRMAMRKRHATKSEIVSAAETPPETIPEMQQSKVKKSKVKESRGSTTTSEFQPDSPPYQLAEHMRNCILQRLPDAKVPTNLQAWARDADKMLRIDKRDFDEAWNLITWVQQDSFWAANCMSIGKLREKYDQLRTRAWQSSRASPYAKETAIDRRLRELGVNT